MLSVSRRDTDNTDHIEKTISLAVARDSGSESDSASGLRLAQAQESGCHSASGWAWASDYRSALDWEMDSVPAFDSAAGLVVLAPAYSELLSELLEQALLSAQALLREQT